MFEKRGQFTIFVILGFILLVAFAFMFFVRSFVVQNQLQAEAQKTVDEALKNTHIDLYVESCLDRVTDDAVYLMGLQGGVLYKSQGGTYPDPGFVGDGSILVNISNITPSYNNSNYGFLNVSRAIIINLNNSCLNITPPMYPFVNKKLGEIFAAYQAMNCDSETGTFGVFNLSKLCNPNGTNKFNASGENDLCGKNHNFYRPTFNELSIQEQLEAYISNKTEQCVNFSIFKDITGYNITVIDMPNTTLTYGKEGLTVQTAYPFKVRIKGKSVTAFANFQVRKEIYLMDLYTYIYSLLKNEYKNIFFDIDKDYTRSFQFNPDYYSVLRTDNPCFYNCPKDLGKYDNLFSIIDNRSLIRGKPLIFNLVIQNRRPVLDLISNSGSAVYDIVVMQGSKIKIAPFGKDSDETPLPEQLFYNYSGWKGSYDEWFNEKCCSNNANGCGIHSIKQCIFYNASFNQSCCNLDLPACLADPSSCVIYNSNISNFWKTSDDYTVNNNHVNASYKTTRYDIGEHHTIVMVQDEAGLEDYQNVSIFVYDLPVTIPNGSNIYSNINNKNASIEDKYTLEALKYSIITKVLEFEWKDMIEPFSKNTSYNITIVPDNITGSFVGIRDIKTAYFRKWNRSKNESIHNITLKGKYRDPSTSDVKWTNGNLFQVQVNLCLPHRNAGTASYPYNNLSSFFVGYNYTAIEDSFLADHTCCNENYDLYGDSGYYYEPNTTSCFDYTEYGDYFAMKARLQIFNTTELMVINPPGTIYDVTNRDYFNSNSFNTQTNPKANDIFNRSFERLCSGDRGNTCNGSIKEVYEIQEQCAQDWSSGQSETCSGPGAPGLLGYKVEKNPFSCVNYGPGSSFETAYNLPKSGTTATPATGICNEKKECSKPNSVGGYYDSGDQYKCTGTCSDKVGDEGECKYARDEDCICNENSCGADSLCDGFSADELPKPLGRCVNSVSDHYEARCSKDTCGLESISTTFECSDSGCSCDIVCDEKTSGYNTGRCDGGTSATYFLDECNATGRAVDKDNICKSDPTKGCNAAPECNSKNPNQIVCDPTPNSKKVSFQCDSSCQKISKNICIKNQCGATCESDTDCTNPSKSHCDPTSCACVSTSTP